MMSSQQKQPRVICGYLRKANIHIDAHGSWMSDDLIRSYRIYKGSHGAVPAIREPIKQVIGEYCDSVVTIQGFVRSPRIVKYIAAHLVSV